MSQAKLTLRPPPNVEFVQGFPGVPPGAPDRPQAAVKGAIEVRLGPQGVKAKYVRIELRKVETLPGGGQQNTFVDFVGQSPINLWQSSDEFSTLHTQDIPFYIRIPESIAPSLALEKGAGVRYELVGQVCVQGKTSFLRRSKPIVLSTSTSIIIDKHELHSTWPIYQQPESRHLTQDAVVLTVDRTQNCYGPGDRVSVMATVKSDSLHTVILRGYEFTLKETTIFRAGPHTTGKKGAPQVKINIIGEHKVPVNQTLYGGTAHRTELACMIPPSHTTTTLTSARHIDITYILGVKALMGTGKPLIMELPVIVSNWPRYVSAEAVRRIGTTPSLSLQPVLSISSKSHNLTSTPSNRPSANIYTSAGPANDVQPHTIAEHISSRLESTDYGQRQPQTMPNLNGHAASASIGQVDEFGFVRPSSAGGPSRPTAKNTATSQRPSTAGSDAHPSADVDFGIGVGAGAGTGTGTGTGTGSRRQRASTLQGNRFTIVNAVDDEIPEEEEVSPPQRALSPQPQRGHSPPRQQKAWPTAEDEKATLYHRAKANVERVQGGLDRMSSVQSFATTHSQPVTPPSQHSTSPKTSHWPTADEEKVRLFNQAQSKARILQGLASQDGSPPPSQQSHTRTDSKDSARNFHSPGRSPYPGSQPVLSAGAALYSAAMSSINKPSASQQGASTPRASPPLAQSTLPIANGVRFPTAEEEKEMLIRYHNARNAVARHQEVTFGPVDTAMGSSSSQIPPSSENNYSSTISRSLSHASSHMPNPNDDDLPPPWVPSSDLALNNMSEKERYRQAFEAREAVAAYSGSPPPSPAPLPSGASSAQPLSAAAEKKLLRQQYESQDASALVSSFPPPAFHSPPQAYELPPHLRARAPPALPTPPMGGNTSRNPLTAAEEKAMLRAKYEAEERGEGTGSMPDPTPPPPFSSPPLPPQPSTNFFFRDARGGRAVAGAGAGDGQPADEARDWTGRPGKRRHVRTAAASEFTVLAWARLWWSRFAFQFEWAVGGRSAAVAAEVPLDNF
ncbi:hypothetical protein EW146_g7230 [Bondarzewia mesenterica]|uniref:Arrestin C-terminal-like domain-containing protein n=1 Tax=Bondarzewia mesenterica TaxID=1095465 RepID=A0A4S4LM32_9AGAM|nr:hypothetical protein EW146_g7230 [Bondarzewia mesenterica]